jgi:hypothetical protein
MDDLDFERIEKLFLKLSSDFDDKLHQQSDELRRGFGADFVDFQHKLELVVGGQQMLGERMDRMEVELKEEIGKVDQHVTAVAADLSAHRKDTEAHHGVYRVKEE